MANSNRIEITYVQAGGVCVFASYAIIMNYFSRGRVSVRGLMDRYIQAFQLTPVSNSDLDREVSIYFHYNNCGMRGFKFIEREHKKNTFFTSRFCIPKNVAVNIGYNPLNKKHNDFLKRKLKKGGLAMVLYPLSGGFHAIVIGFDRRNKGYFYRDPNNCVLSNGDFLKGNSIFEYILFEERCSKNNWWKKGK